MAGEYHWAKESRDVRGERADSVDRELEQAARDFLVPSERWAGQHVARAQAGVQLCECTRSVPIEVVSELGVDHRAEEEREIAVLRRRQLRGTPLGKPGPAADRA